MQALLRVLALIAAKIFIKKKVLPAAKEAAQKTESKVDDAIVAAGELAFDEALEKTVVVESKKGA